MNVIYCRTAQQSSEALDIQKYQTNKYLETQGIKPEQIYIDYGFSAHDTKRPEFNRMIQSIDHIQSITVMSVDRIYRDPHKLLDFFQVLESKNIKLYDVSSGKDMITEPNSALLIDLSKQIEIASRRKRK